jgi:hypothetical protein
MSIKFDRKTGDFIFDLPPRWDSFLEREKKYLRQIVLMIVITAMFLKYGVR